MQNAEQITIRQRDAVRFDPGFWIMAFFTSIVALFVIAQLAGALENDEKTLVGNSLKTVIGIVGIILSYSVTKQLEGKLRHTWTILTWAYAFNAAGDSIWYYYASILGEKPFPSFADVGFLLSYPVMLWALLSYPTRERELDRRKIFADISIVMVSGLTLVWYFIVRPTLASVTAEDYVSPALNLSYTTGDMVLILGIFVAFFRGVEDNLKRALQIIVAGVVCMLVADLGFAYLTLQGTYFGGHWIENFFIFNSLSHIYAAWYQHRKCTSETDDDQKNDISDRRDFLSWIPYVAVALGLALLGWEGSSCWEQPLGKIVFASIGLTTLVVVRQFLAVRENVKLLEEKSRRRHELRFGALVQNSADMISILSPEGEILYESPSIKNVLGYEICELEGTQSFEIVHPDDADNRRRIFETLKAVPKAVVQREVRFRHKDGSWRWLETVSRVVDDEASGLRGLLINSRDVTQRRIDEEKLRVYTEKLELSNRELQDFAYVASHDLQEPLRKVQAFGDRLERKCGEQLSDDGRDYVRRMRDASARMQTLINDLLTFSRVTTNAQPFKPIDLATIATEVVSDLEVRIEQSHGRVEIGSLSVVDADALQMRQLFQNLIGNALKFNREGTPPVVKVYEEDANSGSEIRRIVVEDNGIGFDEKYLDRIFTVFQRLHGRAEYEGSGIGLAVCRKIVERHDGHLTATSRPGEGSKFIIELPIRQKGTGNNES